jgi:hypothetical protein
MLVDVHTSDDPVTMIYLGEGIINWCIGGSLFHALSVPSTKRIES